MLDRRPTPVVLWIVAGVLLLTGLGGRPVNRAQEARVLEVARQMLGKPLDRWMVPRVNERLRLRKPPIAYWGAAGAFSVAHVSEAVGRVPTALASWLTLAGTYLAASRPFGRRAGLLAAGTLLSSYLFFWHARLAETDAWATLFVTFGTIAFWKAVAPETLDGPERLSPRRPALWHHLGAACVAGAFLSKFGPAVFLLVFLVALALVRGRAAALWTFVRCGAILTMVVPPALWLWYASKHADLGQIGEEFSNNWRGEGHGSPFYVYFYMLPVAAAPWTGVMALALVEAVRRWRRDPRLQAVLLWAASVLLPLFVTGNKQPHYLMMVMPALMVLTGWGLDEALRVLKARAGEVKFAGAMGGVFWISVAASAVAGAAAPLAARGMRGTLRPVDFAVGAALLAATVAVVVTGRRRGLAAALAAFAGAWAAAFTVCNAWWWPRVEPNDPRAVAAEFRKVAGDGPYCAYGRTAYLPLCFALREEIPAAFRADDLRDLVRAQPGTHVIVQRRERDAKWVPGGGFVREISVPNDGMVFELYRADPARSVRAIPAGRETGPARE